MTAVTRETVCRLVGPNPGLNGFGRGLLFLLPGEFQDVLKRGDGFVRPFAAENLGKILDTQYSNSMDVPNFPTFQIEKHNETRSYQAHADIMLLVKKPDGSVLYRLSRQYDLDGSLENLESTQKKDFSFYRRVPVSPGDYVLEAIVRDRRTGRVSVRKTGFHAASGVQGQLSLSNIILGKDSVLTVRNEATENPFRLEDPLQVGKVNVVPDLSGVYRKSVDKKLSIFFTAQTTQAQTPIQCMLEFHRDGVPDIKLQQILFDTAGRPIPCVAKIGLDQLGIGKYELRVTATDATGSAHGTAQFRVDR